MSFSQVDNDDVSTKQTEETQLFYITRRKCEIIEQIVQLQTMSKGTVLLGKLFFIIKS